MYQFSFKAICLTQIKRKSNMSAGMVGNIPEFNRFEDNWDIYYERLEQYIKLNGVEPQNKVSLLISIIGTDSYTTLRDVCSPDSPKDKTFDELCELMKVLFTQQGSIYRTRALFYNTFQEEGESVKEWCERLKSLSVDCKFEENFDGIMLDKFVTGIRSEKILDKLCVEAEKLTLDRALEIAVLVEEEDCEDSDVEVVAVEMPRSRRAYRVKFMDRGGRKFGRRHGHHHRGSESETESGEETGKRMWKARKIGGNHGPRRFRRHFGGFEKGRYGSGPRNHRDHHHHHHHHGRRFERPMSGSESETDNETCHCSKSRRSVGRCGRQLAGMKIY